ncbi:transient receptor potential cation channel subfamily V member 3-like [Heterodontus francisci]|uniref:transient receptor potential cation channel subfamily V member 3-like n=1 Tax=Heterodontus francisci TaxID=7792 RepID=UPI00355BFDD9
MSTDTGNPSAAEDFWDLPDDICVKLMRNIHEAESEEQDRSADPPEGFHEPLTDNSINDGFPIRWDASSTISYRPEDYPEGIESIPEESLYECFPFQMDKNNTISCDHFKGEDIIDGCFNLQMNSSKINSSSKPCEEAMLVKDNCALLTCQVNASKIVSGEATCPVEEEDITDGPRFQLDFKTLRLQLFNAIFEGDLDTIDALLQKIEESNGCLSHQKLKDPNTGQTCLMKALLKITNKTEELAQDNKTVEIVKKLISFSKKTGNLKPFINAAYTDKIYRGQTSLHIAVERRRCDLVEFLVRNGAAVDVMAKGRFFRNKKHKQCSFYFGGFPLSLAACTNQLDIVTFLIEHGANPRAQDRAGNTVLHALVSIAYDTLETRSFVAEMYDFILMKSTDMEPHGNLEKITNREGLTPLHLAADTGKIGIFKHILEREIKQKKYKHLSRKFTEWEYGPVSCSLYDLSGVDTIEENSVLQTVVYSSRNRNRHEMLCVEPMNELLQKKWEDFGAYIFIASFLFYLTYIITLTIVASYRPQRNKTLVSTLSYLPWLFQAQNYILLTAVYFLIKEGAEMMYLRRSNLHSILMDGFFHVLFFLQSSLVIIFITLCRADMEDSRILLVLALALGWFNVLYYTRGFKLTGIYCVMIKKIILQDILRFLLVYAVFIVGFAAALASLIEECPPGSDCPYNGFSSAILELFKLTIGLGDLGIQKHSRFPVFFHMLLVLYVILTFVLLLNMLIALMGETVTKISSESEKIWKLQRAVTTLHFERTLPKWLRTRCKNRHSFTEVTVGLTPEGKEDKRWCLRLNEVNWNEWDTRIATVTESIEEQ